MPIGTERSWPRSWVSKEHCSTLKRFEGYPPCHCEVALRQAPFDKLRANGINPFWVVLKETTEKCGGIARSVAVARRSRSKLGAGFLAYARNKLSNLKRGLLRLWLAMTVLICPPSRQGRENLRASPTCRPRGKQSRWWKGGSMRLLRLRLAMTVLICPLSLDGRGIG